MMQDSATPTEIAVPDSNDTVIDLQEFGSRTVWWLSCRAEQVQASGFLRGQTTLPLEGYRSGRTDHPVYRDERGTLLMWKKCLRGGWLSHLVKDRYWKPDRFIEEMKLCHQIQEKGVSTSRILAVAATDAAIGYRIDMLVELETEVRTLLELLEDSALSANQRQKILDSSADTIYQFHEQGWLHGDLNLMNILLKQTSSTDYRTVLVDLDPGGLSPTANRLGNLTRLVRSYRKSRSLKTPPLLPGEGFRFLYRATGGNRQLLASLLRNSRKILSQEEWRR
ncbi:MAG: lipopolysaccharide kinase InaA family protein [Planctomycetota bacterium]|nr:lipopolysaccharide kinase InaA family protein [Planctomycetota bacterium]